MTDVNPEYKGARFYKCALQVNPWAYVESHGTKTSYGNENDYNDAMVRSCKDNGIQVVGLADHGSVNTSESLRQKLQENDIVVFPGFEIASSEKIHMVCLYPEKSALDDINGYLVLLMGENFSELSKNPMHPSSLSCEGIAKKIKNEQHGFWYAAHLTTNNGLLRLSGAGDNYVTLWKRDDLVKVGQIPGPLEDLPENYKKIIENQNPDYKRNKPIAIINAKDATPDTLDDDSASTLIKMTTPNLEALKDAFHDPESRIRLNRNVQEFHHSKIISISWEGGDLLGNNEIYLSENLNAIIGGHGSGKSTLLESIRYVLDLQPKSKEAHTNYERICVNNLSNTQITLKVRSKINFGNEYTISRRYGSPPQVHDSSGDVKDVSPIDILPEVEIYSQNEILSVANNSSDQLKLLDRFLPEQKAEENTMQALMKHIVKNREQMADTYEKKSELEAELSNLKSLNERADAFKKAGIEDKLKEMGQLNKQRNIIPQAKAQMEAFAAWANNYSGVFDLDFISKAAIENMPNKDILERLRNTLEGLRSAGDSCVNEIKNKIEPANEAIQEISNELSDIHDSQSQKLQNLLAQLPDYGGESGAEIARKASDLMRKISNIEAKKNRKDALDKQIQSLEQERRNLLDKFTNTAFQKSNKINDAIQEINNGALKNKVRITLERMKNKDDLKSLLRSIPGVGGKATEWIDEHDVSPSALAGILKGENVTEKLKEKYRIPLGVAQKITYACGKESTMLMELEEVVVSDNIIIELNVAHDKERPNYQALENLSTGQKCIAILNIILMDNDDPLIMDQPEDNLDNAFIAERIVKDLRECKEKRQFVFATHNANIPIFGDADLILTLKHSGGKTHISDDNIGSVDKPTVRESAARILDGGKEAFYMRQHKYGFDYD